MNELEKLCPQFLQTPNAAGIIAFLFNDFMTLEMRNAVPEDVAEQIGRYLHSRGYRIVFNRFYKQCEEQILESVQQDYEEVMEDHRRLVRELDVLINGEEGAAQQASLCDIVAQVKREGLKVAKPAVAQEPVVQRTLGYEQGIQDAAKMLDTKANDYAKEFGFDDMGALEFSRESQREYHSTLVELAEEVRSMEATNSAPAVAQSWELNEETAKFLADLILANDEPTPVTLSVGFIKDDDGKIQHGLRVHESEYPEEGAELLVESTPSPQKAPPVEVVRNAILGVQCAAELLEALPSLIETNVEVHAQIHETYEFLKGVLQTAKEHGL